MPSPRAGSAPRRPGFHADDEEERRPTTVEPAFTLDWGALRARRTASRSACPSSRSVPRRCSSHRPCSRAGRSCRRSPPPRRPGAPAAPAATTAPSRLPVASSGSFSLGLRLGFPEPEAKAIPGAPASALSESLRRGQVINETDDRSGAAGLGRDRQGPARRRRLGRLLDAHRARSRPARSRAACPAGPARAARPTSSTSSSSPTSPEVVSPSRSATERASQRCPSSPAAPSS